MAGSLYRHPNGSWVLRVYVGRDPLTGKKLSRSRSFRGTKREAELALAAFLTDSSGKPPAPRGKTFGELVDRWFEARSSDWSPSTAQQTRWIINRQLVGLRDRLVTKIGTEDLDTFYAAMRRRGGRGGKPLSGATVARAHTVIRLAMAQAVAWGWRSDNPAVLAKPGRQDAAEIRPPSAEGVRALFDAALQKDLELVAFIALEAETGARRGELAALRFTDFGPQSVTIARALVVGPDNEENRARYAGHCWHAGTVRSSETTLIIEKPKPKNRRSIRTIALSSSALAVVAELRRERVSLATEVGTTWPADAFVFAADVEGTRPMRPETWTRRFARLRAEVGLDTVRLHDLRHYVATTMLAAGTDLATVAGRLGHGGGGKTTLAIYGHFLEGAPPDRAAAEMLAGLIRQPADASEAASGNVVPLRRP